MVGVAVKVTLVPAQIAPEGTAAMPTLTGKLGLTVMVIAFEVAGFPVGQVAFEVRMHLTTSLFASVVIVNAELLLPEFTPFTCHWYEGLLPPLAGVAVNVTLIPAQMAPEGAAAMPTLTGRFGLTVIVMALEVAGFPVGQVALDVSIQVTASPLVREAVVKVEVLVPVLTPFTCHW